MAEQPHTTFVILSLMGNEPNSPTKGHARQAASTLDDRTVTDITTQYSVHFFHLIANSFEMVRTLV